MSSPPLLLVGSSTPLKVDVLNASLEHEMKAVGVEVADPYDSNSEINLSMCSMESIKNDRSEDAVSIASSIPEQLLEEAPKKEERTYMEEEGTTYYNVYTIFSRPPQQMEWSHQNLYSSLLSSTTARLSRALTLPST